MLPLIGLATSFFPELIKLLAGDTAGTIAGTVSKAVTDVTGASDADTARRKLADDPQIAAALQQRLAEISLEATKARYAEAAQSRRDEIDALKASIDNTAGARGMTEALTTNHSSIAFTAPAVSMLVSFGFFLILFVLIFHGLPDMDQNTTGIVNLTIGVLGTAFATVVNFWLGSSSSSRAKDAAALQMQSTAASQTGELLQVVRSVQQAHADQAKSAFAGLQQFASLGAAAPARPEPMPAAPPRDNFEHCLAVTLVQEGGFSDDPQDPGGATNLGITQATLQAFRGAPVEADDVRSLSQREATEIYRANYWLPARCGDMPRGLDLMVFDFAVNAGPRTAVRCIQRIAGVKDDGSVGPMTLAALARADQTALISDMAKARLSYYQALPTWGRFGKGWANRVRQVEQAALLMR